jgi:hypothetical protein
VAAVGPELFTLFKLLPMQSRPTPGPTRASAGTTLPPANADPIPQQPTPPDYANEQHLSLEERSANRARYANALLRFDDDYAAWVLREQQRNVQDAQDWIAQSVMDAPCDLHHRMTGTVWCAYDTFAQLEALFDAAELTLGSARLLRHISLNARLLCRTLRELAAQQPAAQQPAEQQPAARQPSARLPTVPPDWALPETVEAPAFEVARRVSAVSHAVLRLRRMAAHCAQQARDRNIVLAFLVSVQHLAHTEFMLNRFLLQHSLPLVCPDRNDTPDHWNDTPPQRDVAPQQLNDQSIDYQTIIQESRNGVTDIPVQQLRPPVVPSALKTPPDGPRLNASGPAEPPQHW